MIVGTTNSDKLAKAMFSASPSLRENRLLDALATFPPPVGSPENLLPEYCLFVVVLLENTERPPGR